jgi:hypothetical protein
MAELVTLVGGGCQVADGASQDPRVASVITRSYTLRAVDERPRPVRGSGASFQQGRDDGPEPVVATWPRSATD